MENEMETSEDPPAETPELAPVHVLPNPDAPDTTTVQAPESPGEPTLGFAELDSAAGADAVSLEHIVEVRRMSLPAWNPDPSSRAGYVSRLPKLWTAFRNQHGPVIDAYFAKSIPAAAVLSEHHGLHIRHPDPLPPQLEEGLWSAVALGRQALLTLKKPTDCLPVWMSVHSIVVRLLSALDAQAVLPAGDPQAGDRLGGIVRGCRNEIAKARSLLDQIALREARKEYLAGMALGILVLLPFASGLGSLVGKARMPELDVRLLLGILMAGGIGALVSVMARMTSGNLTLDIHAGRTLTVLSGTFRPLLGALFGLGLFVLIEGGLLPLKGGSQTPPLYFYTALSLVAGFSERWAQDMLSAGVQRVASAGPGGPETPPRAS
jgi:hypothetical protein